MAANDTLSSQPVVGETPVVAPVASGPHVAAGSPRTLNSEPGPTSPCPPSPNSKKDAPASVQISNLEVEMKESEQAPKKGGWVASATTIFSVWNTMIGSSLLSFPWGFTNAGLVVGIIVVVAVALVTWYTTYLVIANGNGKTDFIDLCNEHLGKVGKWIGWVGSVAILFGALAIYTTLITGSVYNFIGGLYEVDKGHEMRHYDGWNKKSAKAIIAVCYILPLIALPPFKWTTKASSCGVACMMINLVLIIVSASINWDSHAEKKWVFESKFYYISGIACLCFFTHNFVLQLAEGRERKAAIRDVSIGFAGGVSTVLITGCLAYAALGSSLPQNYLDYYSNKYGIGITMRIVLTLQLSTIMPLVFGIFRTQCCAVVIGTEKATNLAIWWRALFAVFFLTLMTLIAIFYPNIGDVMRFVGSICGFLLEFLMPIGVHLMIKYRAKTLGPITIALHSALLIFGALIIVSQFI
eukprot:m51a1_g12201 hypothetical protein (468) ;mRNA; f:56006-57941